MLVLSRRAGETIVIGGDISITVLGATKQTTRLGIEAPRKVPVVRQELRTGDQRAMEERDAAKKRSVGRSR
uniref:carbon storage regulator n=1 Tax=Botrimarina colliarenosi TaxID=2528001 RepID=UPI0011B3FED4